MASSAVTRGFSVDSPWFAGEADVPTFFIEELSATKNRASFQGRDLFDLWLAPKHEAAASAVVSTADDIGHLVASSHRGSEARPSLVR